MYVISLATLSEKKILFPIYLSICMYGMMLITQKLSPCHYILKSMIIVYKLLNWIIITFIKRNYVFQSVNFGTLVKNHLEFAKKKLIKSKSYCQQSITLTLIKRLGKPSVSLFYSISLILLHSNPDLLYYILIL